MKKTTEHTLTTWAPPDEPSWDRARGYAEGIRRSMEDVVRLGLELSALREQWFAQGKGGGGDRKSQANQKSTRNTLLRGDSGPSERTLDLGWQARVKQELGISHMTAYRIIERADAIISLSRLQEGQPFVYKQPRTGEPRRLEPSPDVVQMAGAALAEITAGTISAPRALAGLLGESFRRSNQGGSARKAQTNHAQNIRNALVKLRTSLQQWRRIDPDDRAALEKMWADIKECLPETWA